VVTELTEGPFVTAYGTLVRVRHQVDRSYVPLPAEARKRIYEVSPRFAELAGYLEGNAGREWSVHGCSRLGICDDIAGGWMIWALRGAAANAKHYATGSEAARYWAEVASQVDHACEDGRLACEARGFGLLPPLRRLDLRAFSDSMARATASVALFRDLAFQSYPSQGTAKQLDVFSDVTRTRLEPDSGGIGKSLPLQDRLVARKKALLECNLAVYRATMPVLAVASLLALLVAVAIAISRRQVGGSELAAGSLLAGGVTRLALLALVDSTSFPTVNAAYLSPAHALLVGFVVLALHATLAGVRKVATSPGSCPR